MRRRLILAAAAAVLIAAPIASVAAGPEAPFPLGYRTWTHIKSGWIGEGGLGYPHFAGLHHIYANKNAMTGYRTGTFPTGSVVVFDVLATKAGVGSLTTADRRFRDVMEKTAEGWRFTEFNLDSHSERNVTTEAGVKECAACHAQAKQDHVFSTFAETDDR
jgi:hypothetical protein